MLNCDKVCTASSDVWGMGRIPNFHPAEIIEIALKVFHIFKAYICALTHNPAQILNAINKLNT